jgi:hypothetical protein
MQLSADTVRGHSGHRLANTIEPRLTVDCPMRPPRGVPVQYYQSIEDRCESITNYGVEMRPAPRARR